MNATRVMNDLDERVLESRRRLEAEIHEYLVGVWDTADRALQRRVRQLADRAAQHRQQPGPHRLARPVAARICGQRRQVAAQSGAVDHLFEPERYACHSR